MTVLPLPLTLAAAVILLRALTAWVRQAKRFDSRYELACSQYASLVDHRIANPLTAISGAAQTLLDESIELDQNVARQLLEIIADQARRIETTSLSPAILLGPEERNLCLAMPHRRNARPAIALSA